MELLYKLSEASYLSFEKIHLWKRPLLLPFILKPIYGGKESWKNYNKLRLSYQGITLITA
jgi:hypothetical protein